MSPSYQPPVGRSAVLANERVGVAIYRQWAGRVISPPRIRPERASTDGLDRRQRPCSRSPLVTMLFSMSLVPQRSAAAR